MATATRSSKQRTHIMREKRDALQLASEIENGLTLSRLSSSA
ncbi:hypothetical protein PPTG_24803 [Phytophthora nicotianae INRA-310]|uniref:Uncharacterized protein n=1 Tax=Phytophthora nicotianae (strain INRA-310) TaxID=761204 RepID=W2PB42_PHYN3|nr:hypothetical protein PPTG_24803 [Phytophthora nicotianae INRA-310]ETM97870.1 hypothetical protein PPTG_24803 [Phytophthora nicotianae INRA-310]